MFYQDKSGQEALAKKGTAFSGYTLWSEHVLESKKVYFTTPLHCELLNSPRLLIPGCNLKFVFTKQNEDFLILTEITGKKFKIKMHELAIEYRSIEVSKDTLARHQTRIESMPALYPLNKIKITHTISQNIQDYTIENLVSGFLPQQIFVSFCLIFIFLELIKSIYFFL